MRELKSVVPIVRGAGLIAVLSWAWYMGALFRTSDWGYHDLLRQLALTLFVTSLMALPLALIPLVGLPARAQAKWFALLTFATLLSVEAFARTQEHLVVQRFNGAPGKDYVETRWWPFDGHTLGVQQGKWWACD